MTPDRIDPEGPEIGRLRRLIQVALDSLDAEKTPDYEDGHDRAVSALVEALTGRKPVDPYQGPTMTLDELAPPRGVPDA
jgi:hypothetical protein